MGRSRIIDLFNEEEIVYILDGLNLLEGQYLESECDESASCINKLHKKINNCIELALILNERKSF